MTNNNVTVDVTKAVSFITKMKTFLDETCVPGSGIRVSRTDALIGGGLDPNELLPVGIGVQLVSSLIHCGLVEGYTISPGREGGVVRIGEKNAPRTSSSRKMDDEWVARLNTVLNSICPLFGRGTTNRDKVAHAMHLQDPSEDLLKIPAKITKAMDTGLTPGFSSKRGSGIFRTAAITPIAITPVAETLIAAAEETVDETIDSELVVEAPEVNEEVLEASVEVSDEPVIEVAEETLIDESSKPEDEHKGKKGKKGKKGLNSIAA